MEFFEAVRQRRSVRKFSTDPVPEAVIQKAIDAALDAPNSSNLQPWEFYWVRSPQKKKALVELCFSQPAAATAAELIVAVSRLDTWKRNRDLQLEAFGGKVPASVVKYYKQLVPVMYVQDPFGIFAFGKWILFNTYGVYKPAPRRPVTRADLFEVVTKTTALACENLMLALVAQGFASCPMEGFDESRVKKLLRLNRHCHVVMILGVGKALPEGIFAERYRIPKSLTVFEV